MAIYPKYNLLNCNDISAKLEWQNISTLFSEIDIFYSPEYLSLFELHGDGRAKLFIYHESPGKIVIHPFMLRKINDISIFADLPDDLFDIISPYGYSGYLRNNNQIDMGKFQSIFNDYCLKNNIISEFLRFNPCLENHTYAPDGIELEYWNDVVIIDLKQDMGMIWQDISSNRRNRIKKAAKDGIRIIKDDYFKYIDNFYNIYNLTMDNVGANRYYYFSKEWFNKLFNYLFNKVSLYHAIYNDDIIASAIFIKSNLIAHYFLSWTLYEARKMEPMSLLLYQATIDLKNEGLKYLHLGGGLERDDNLFQYKAKFSKLRRGYYIGKKIFDEKIYNYLTLTRATQDPENVERNYFPAYRCPSDHKSHNHNELKNELSTINTEKSARQN